MGIHANWKEVGESQGQGGGLLPAGVHKCIITEVKESDWKDGMKKWEVKLVGIEGRGVDKVLTDWLYMTPKALWRLHQLACRAGLPDMDKARTIEPQELMGKVIGVDVGLHEYQGKMQPRVTEYLRDDKELQDRMASTPASQVPKDDDLPF